MRFSHVFPYLRKNENKEKKKSQIIISKTFRDVKIGQSRTFRLSEPALLNEWRELAPHTEPFFFYEPFFKRSSITLWPITCEDMGSYHYAKTESVEPKEPALLWEPSHKSWLSKESRNSHLYSTVMSSRRQLKAS